MKHDSEAVPMQFINHVCPLPDLIMAYGYSSAVTTIILCD